MKRYLVRGVLAVLFCFICLSAVSDSSANERFEVLPDGTVKDLQKGLMWAGQDNGANINWSGAGEYCKNYSAGGFNDWRMPVASELASLYGNKKKIKGKDYSQSIDIVTDKIKITGPWVWTARRTSKNKALAYGFNYGVNRRLHRGSGGGRRALPVRSLP